MSRIQTTLMRCDWVEKILESLPNEVKLIAARVDLKQKMGNKSTIMKERKCSLGLLFIFFIYLVVSSGINTLNLHNPISIIPKNFAYGKAIIIYSQEGQRTLTGKIYELGAMSGYSPSSENSILRGSLRKSFTPTFSEISEKLNGALVIDLKPSMIANTTVASAYDTDVFPPRVGGDLKPETEVKITKKRFKAGLERLIDDNKENMKNFPRPLVIPEKLPPDKENLEKSRYTKDIAASLSGFGKFYEEYLAPTLLVPKMEVDSRLSMVITISLFDKLRI